MTNRSTLIALCALIPSLGMAQSQHGERSQFETAPAKPAINVQQHEAAETMQRGGGGALIWSEDFAGAVNTADSVFATNGVWGKAGINGDVWRFTTSGPGGCFSTNIGMPSFTTASNGFLQFDADSANCVDATANPPLANSTELFGEITSPVIDLSSNPSVVLSFEYTTRWCCSGAGLDLIVSVSGDGGATWPTEFIVETPDVNNQMTSSFEVNVSNIMGGMTDARFKLSWGAQSHYYWEVDDIVLSVAPSDDMRMNYAYVSHNNTSEEYGRIPVAQLQSDIAVGAEVFNFGSVAQTNVKMLVEIMDSNGTVVLADSATEATINPADTFLFELMPMLPTMDLGVYSVAYTVTSDADSLTSEFGGNNELARNFEVTDNVFSIDAIGNHPSGQMLDDISTESFTDATDGLMVLSYYDVLNYGVAVGVEILFSNATDDGGFVAVALHDTINVLGAVEDLLSPLAESDLLELDNIGSAPEYFPFDDEYEIVDPNAFYVGVEMFSDNNTNDIGILDDVTVPQPGYSSMIYIADDQVYGNGNASAVRLITAQGVGVNEADDTGIIFGLKNNPSNSALGYTISTDNNTNLVLNVNDLSGKTVYSSVLNTGRGLIVGEINTSNLANGIYSIQLQGENSSYVKKFVVSH